MMQILIYTVLISTYKKKTLLFQADCIEKGYEQWLEDENTETDFDTDSKRSNTDDSEELLIKTALKRSQKQMGRYAESSSDSEDSRSRPRNRKRGRPRKRLKSFSDSGSVSDSLGSDGQKQKRSNIYIYIVFLENTKEKKGG